MDKFKNLSKWGSDTAKERYSQKDNGLPEHKETNVQGNQDPVDKHDPGYDNDTSGWVHGKGKPYPNFDSGKGK